MNEKALEKILNIFSKEVSSSQASATISDISDSVRCPKNRLIKFV